MAELNLFNADNSRVSSVFPDLRFIQNLWNDFSEEDLSSLL